jgi:hypothetical protein
MTNPGHETSHLLSYNFRNDNLNRVKWPFGHIDTPIQYAVLDSRPTVRKLVEYTIFTDSKERTEIPKYSNLDMYSDLADLIKSETMYHYVSYGNENGKYQLDVWHDQAYVVRSGNEITAVHIDTSYDLQEGDYRTYVWYFNNNFAVFNLGDIYSVILIPLKSRLRFIHSDSD